MGRSGDLGSGGRRIGCGELGQGRGSEIRGLGAKVSEGSRPSPAGARDGTGSGRRGGGQGSCSGPPRPYPPPRSRRSESCRCPTPAAAPAAASCCARGRPWPARWAQRGSARRSPGWRPPMALRSRRQVERDSAPAPPARPPRRQPAPPLRPFGPAPGACRRPPLPPLCALLEPVPRGGTRVRDWETVTLAGPRAKTRRSLASCGTVDIPVDLSGLSFHLCERGIRACLCLWAPWKIRQDLTSVKAFY